MNSVIAAHTRLGGIGYLAVLVGKMGRGNGDKERYTSLFSCLEFL